MYARSSMYTRGGMYARSSMYTRGYTTYSPALTTSLCTISQRKLCTRQPAALLTKSVDYSIVDASRVDHSICVSHHTHSPPAFFKHIHTHTYTHTYIHTHTHTYTHTHTHTHTHTYIHTHTHTHQHTHSMPHKQTPLPHPCTPYFHFLVRSLPMHLPCLCIDHALAVCKAVKRCGRGVCMYRMPPLLTECVWDPLCLSHMCDAYV